MIYQFLIFLGVRTEAGPEHTRRSQRPITLEPIERLGHRSCLRKRYLAGQYAERLKVRLVRERTRHWRCGKVELVHWLQPKDLLDRSYHVDLRIKRAVDCMST